MGAGDSRGPRICPDGSPVVSAAVELTRPTTSGIVALDGDPGQGEDADTFVPNGDNIVTAKLTYRFGVR